MPKPGSLWPTHCGTGKNKARFCPPAPLLPAAACRRGKRRLTNGGGCGIVRAYLKNPRRGRGTGYTQKTARRRGRRGAQGRAQHAKTAAGRKHQKRDGRRSLLDAAPKPRDGRGHPLPESDFGGCGPRRGKKPRHRKLPHCGRGEPGRILRHGLPGQRRGQVAGSGGLFAGAAAGRRAGTAGGRADRADRPRAAAGRLPGHLLHRQGAGTQMAKPGRMPRALLRRAHDRGRRRLL